MKRLHQILLIVSAVLASWLGMQAVHEAGHVLGACMTGGRVSQVVLHPLTISRTDATVPGGALNTASGFNSFAAGFQATASHQATFVWSDGVGLFGSTGPDQFLIHASGGVGIGTNAPAEALDVNGNVKANGLCIGTDCRTAWPSGNGGGITGVSAGNGLTGGGTSGSVTLGVDFTTAQMRVTGACAIGAAVQAGEPQPAPKLKPPLLKLTSSSVSQGNVALYFGVTNPNDLPLPFVGYTPDSFEGGLKSGTIAPIYRIELRRYKTWKPGSIGWCGTGIGPVSIPAKGSVTFAVLQPIGDWEAVRVGLSWFAISDRTKPEIAWSDSITRETLTKNP